MREKTLLEVSMMLGDAIDKLNALSVYKDPYAHLKEAQARGEVIQAEDGTGGWFDLLPSYYVYKALRDNLDIPYPPESYRIKPKTKTLYKWAYKEYDSNIFYESKGFYEEEWMFNDCEAIVSGTKVKRLDYTAIEVEA